jgi:hypothetical protein
MGEERKVELFNSPIETALRSLVIIQKFKSVSLDSLVIYDYLCINSKDFDGPESLHVPVPNRNVQILVRRQLIQNGLQLLIAKDLINIKPLKGGLYYSSNKSTSLFTSHLSTEYKFRLEERVNWVFEKYGDWSETKLKKFVDVNIENWGNEISMESLNI